MTDTIPNVPRELLERIAELLSWKGGISKHLDDVRGAYGELRTLLSAPSPAGVDGLEVVAYIWSHEKGIMVPTMRNKPPFWPGKGGYTSEPLCRLSDAQAIIDGLRGEVAKINSDRLACWAEFKVMTRACLDAEKERDQQAKRIGELERLLWEARLMTFVVNSGQSGVLRGHIDAALSAGKEGE